MRRPGAVEERQHGCVAGEDPALAAFAGARLRVGDRDRVRGRERPRQGLCDLGAADRREGRRRAEALAVEVARKGAQARELAHQGAALHALAAPRRHEGAHVQRLQPHEVADRRRLAEMDRQEGQELAQIPGVSLDGLRRQPALAGEPRQPRGGLATRVGRAGQDGLGGVRRDGLGPT